MSEFGQKTMEPRKRDDGMKNGLKSHQSWPEATENINERKTLDKPEPCKQITATNFHFANSASTFNKLTFAIQTQLYQKSS